MSVSLEKFEMDFRRNWWNRRDVTGPCRAPYIIQTELRNCLVPCGNCLPCRQRKKLSRIGRIMGEAQERPGSEVLTLTYSPDAIAKIMRERGFEKEASMIDALSPEAQNMAFARCIDAEWIEAEWHRFRNRLIYYYGSDFKYVVSAQLGEKTGRFHFHVIVLRGPAVNSAYPLKDRTSKEWIDPDRLWPHGHRLVDAVTTASVGYVLEYLTRADKNTVYHSKSQCIGEAYFRQWMVGNGPKKPYMRDAKGMFEVDDRMFPMCRRFREIAKEEGFLKNEGGTTASEYLAMGGPFWRELTNEQDLAAKRRLAFVPPGQMVDPAIGQMAERLKAARKRPNSLRSPGEIRKVVQNAPK
jgi:hypothetical protein